MALLDQQIVKDLLPQEDLADTQITAAMRLVAGWLKDASGSDTVPDALADDDPLFSPALELTVLAVTNIEDLVHFVAGPTQKQWQRVAPGLLARRDAILDRVRRHATLPSGDFPCAQPWPDPAYGVTRWWNSGIDPAAYL
jgi:hypothetical protein